MNQRIVVIGGGVIGCSTAYHLLKAGVKDVTILEAGTIGSATSSAGAGFVAQWSIAAPGRLRPEGLTLQSYSIDYYKRLADQGYDIGCRPNGTLFLAVADEQLEDRL